MTVRWREIPAMMTVGLMLVVSCAKQAMPPGGPADDVPPAVGGTEPESGAVNVSVTAPVVFRFSEPVDERSVENNVFVVPIPAEWPVFEWGDGGTELTMRFPEPLNEDATYVISIGAKARDRRGNSFADTATLTFSTGDVIENGVMTGMVVPYSYFDESPESVSGVDVTAFLLDGPDDGPDPRNDVPDYFTQTGADGTWRMSGLSRGLYRIYVIGDRDGDGFYSEGSDLIGVAPRDVELAADDSLTAPTMMISTRDTSLVQLRSMRATGRRHVEIYFDRPVVPENVDVALDGIEMEGWFIDAVKPQLLHLVTAPMEDEARYGVTRLSVGDRDGNTLAPQRTEPYIIGVGQPDTTALRIVEWGPELLQPDDGPVTVVFNRMLDLDDGDDSRYAIRDVSGRDLMAELSAPNSLSLEPGDGWEGGWNYVVVFDSTMVRAVGGGAMVGADSTLVFRVAPEDTLGFIEGTIEDAGERADAFYRVRLRNIDIGRVFELEVTGAGTWESGPVLPGRYSTFAFRDDDRDGEVDRGRAFPFRPAEPVAVFQDTVSVMSRWTNKDIHITFK